MFAPTRLFLSLRPRAAPALIASASAVAALFAATPFLLPAVADRFDVSLGTSALISSAQVAGFAATTFAAARTLTPSKRILVGAALTSVVANAASAGVDVFGLLLALRVAAGVAAGLLVWLAWTDAMRDTGVMRDVAAIGPATMLVAAPLFGWLASTAGDRPVYLVLAAASIPVALLSARFEGERKVRRRMSPSRSNVLLLVGLGLLTMFGSSLFVFIASIASTQNEMGPVAVALGYSVNAVAAFVGARVGTRPEFAWRFVLVMAGAVALIAFVHEPIALYVGMAAWGFAFWMTVPGVLGQIADWSLVPEERVGDAQAMMALGRAIGPLIGAALVGADSFGGLSLTVISGLAGVATIMGGVSRYRKSRSPVAPGTTA